MFKLINLIIKKRFNNYIYYFYKTYNNEITKKIILNIYIIKTICIKI